MGAEQKKREEARCKARRVLEDAVVAREAERLRSALTDGETIGLDEKELESARETLVEVEAELKAKEEATRRVCASLHQAILARKAEQLRSALVDAESVGLDDGELTLARTTLKEVETELQAKEEAER